MTKQIDRMREKAEHLAKAAGVRGVLVVPPDTTKDTLEVALTSAALVVGEVGALPASLGVLLSADTAEVRILLGSVTILAVHEHSATIAVAIESGHQVAKSLRRMIRKAAKGPC